MIRFPDLQSVGAHSTVASIATAMGLKCAWYASSLSDTVSNMHRTVTELVVATVGGGGSHTPSCLASFTCRPISAAQSRNLYGCAGIVCRGSCLYKYMVSPFPSFKTCLSLCPHTQAQTCKLEIWAFATFSPSCLKDMACLGPMTNDQSGTSR